MRSAFTRESDLCAAFMIALSEGWVAYPTTGGFDILLVGETDGFQAKLRLNAKVINQACEDGHPDEVTAPGPDRRAVLVLEGTAEPDLRRLCGLLSLTVSTLRGGAQPAFAPPLPRPKQDARGMV